MNHEPSPRTGVRRGGRRWVAAATKRPLGNHTNSPEAGAIQKALTADYADDKDFRGNGEDSTHRAGLTFR